MAPDLRSLVDVFLKADKRLVGFTQWQQGNMPGVFRMARPLEVAGELSAAQALIVDAWPRESFLKFHIVLTAGPAVWRLDYGKDETHKNPLNCPSHLPQGLIYGSHYHSWIDNRRLATKASLPKELRYANVLNTNKIRRFDQAFRWFCGETVISLAPGDVPPFPTPDTLL